MLLNSYFVVIGVDPDTFFDFFTDLRNAWLIILHNVFVFLFTIDIKLFLYLCMNESKLLYLLQNRKNPTPMKNIITKIPRTENTIINVTLPKSGLKEVVISDNLELIK